MALYLLLRGIKSKVPLHRLFSTGDSNHTPLNSNSPLSSHFRQPRQKYAIKQRPLNLSFLASELRPPTSPQISFHDRHSRFNGASFKSDSSETESEDRGCLYKHLRNYLKTTETEEKDADYNDKQVVLNDLRNCIIEMKDDKSKKASLQRLDTSAQLGRNPKEQEHLVENVVEKPLKKDAVGRKKVKWSDTSVEVFLKICIEEVVAGNRYDTHFTKIGWANVIEKFNEATNLTYEYKELRKKWDNLKKEWALWTKLVGRDTGLGRDAAKKTISASDECWEAKIQENPKVAKLRKHDPKYWLQMEILFRDIVDSGSVEYAPPKDSRVPEGIPKGIEGMHVDDIKKDDNDQERVFETETGITS